MLILPDESEAALFEELTKETKEKYNENEIEVMIKIYRWTKSERDRCFFPEVLKRIPNYRSALKKLRATFLIQLVRGKGPYKITEDGIRAGILMLKLRDMGLI